MSHVAKVVKTKQLGDGALAITARCCDDKTTDSALTIYIDNLSDEQVKAEVERHRNRVALNHERMERGKALVESLKEN